MNQIHYHRYIKHVKDLKIDSKIPIRFLKYYHKLCIYKCYTIILMLIFRLKEKLFFIGNNTDNTLTGSIQTFFATKRNNGINKRIPNFMFPQNISGFGIQSEN